MNTSASRKLTIATAVAAAVIFMGHVSMAQNQFVEWNAAQEYDIGYNPSVAVSGTTVVEVHNGEDNYGPMWYHVGQQNPLTGAITWGPSYNYDNGYNPSVAISGTTVVEVHNGQMGSGPLWYHVGQVSESQITWGPSIKYDSGYNPTIALAPCGSGPTLTNAPVASVANMTALPISIPVKGTGCLTAIEAHNSSAAPGPMYYHVGQVVTSAQELINFGPSNYYDWGWNPSVAAAPCVTSSGANCGITVLEVHNGQGQAGPMWYHAGNWTSGSTIAWGPSTNYDWGYNPKVAIAYMGVCSGPVYVVLEVHDGSILNQTSLGEVALWYHAGTWNANNPQKLSLGNSLEYDSGWNPSVAVSQSPYIEDTPIEVHNGNQGLFGPSPIPMWFHVGSSGWCIF